MRHPVFIWPYFLQDYTGPSVNPRRRRHRATFTPRPVSPDMIVNEDETDVEGEPDIQVLKAPRPQPNHPETVHGGTAQGYHYFLMEKKKGGVQHHPISLYMPFILYLADHGCRLGYPPGRPFTATSHEAPGTKGTTQVVKIL